LLNVLLAKYFIAYMLSWSMLCEPNFVPAHCWDRKRWIGINQMLYRQNGLLGNVVSTKCCGGQMLYWLNVVLIKCCVGQMLCWSNVVLVKKLC